MKPTGESPFPAIMVVDDAPFFRRQLCDLLQERGFRPVEAASGKEAEGLAADPDIAAVLLDIEMPGITGPEVLRSLKRLRPELPVIMISVHQDFATVREVLRDGALDYLTKPLKSEDLFCALERALRTLETSRGIATARREAQRRMTDLVLLREVGETASSGESLQRLIDKILDSITSALEVETASLMLVESDGKLAVRGARGHQVPRSQMVRIDPGQGIAGHVLQTGDPVLVADLSRDRRFAPSEWSHHYDTGSLLSVPLRSRERPIGVLNVNNKRSGETFSAEDQNLLLTIAHQASLAIENFRLVSSLRRQTRELEETNRRLILSHQARSRLVCNLSHELNTPLTSVLGYVDLILTFGADFGQAETQGYLLRVQEEGGRMERIVSGMLRLFSLDSGAEEWEWQVVSPSAVLEGVLEHYRSRCEVRGLKVEKNLLDPLPALWGDPEKIFLLFDALVDNAVKFNCPGGRVRVDGEERALEGARHLYVRIFNDGPSVPPGAASDIFEGFNQLGEQLTGKPAGVGVGLTICRLIVEGMQGKIVLEDTRGAGTAFGVWLPIHTEKGAVHGRGYDQGSQGIQICSKAGGDQEIRQA